MRTWVRHDRERGSGSVTALAVAGAVAVVLAAGLLVAAVAVTGQQARTAADLAALAAVGRAGAGEAAASACRTAAEVTERNGAALVRCGPRAAPASAGAVIPSLPVIEVEVERQVLGTSWSVRAVAAATAVSQRP